MLPCSPPHLSLALLLAARRSVRAALLLPAEGAFMMWAKQKNEDFDSAMATFMRYFERLIERRPG